MGSLYRRKQKMPDGTVRELPTIWLKYYQHGRQMRESTGTTKETVARRMLRNREGDVEHGIPVNPKVGRVTFEDAAKDLVNEYQTNGRKSRAHVQRRLDKHLSPVFGGKRLSSLTTPMIRDFTATRQTAGASNAEINRELAVLKRMFTLAVQAGKLYHRPHIPMLKERNARAGFFERSPFDAVRAHLPAPLAAVAAFAYYTGWRVPSEVLTLEWRQVDFAAGVVRLEPNATKNEEAREFPFAEHPDLQAVLTGQRDEADRLKRQGVICARVFHRDGKPIRSFYDAWRAACRAAGCPGRIPHDFRRTAVRNLVRAGVSEKVAMTLTGHKTRAVFDRYDIVSGTDTREAVAKLAGTIPGTMTATAPVDAVARSA
jgi:integrase